MLKKRIVELEKIIAPPGPAPVVVIDAGDPIPVGARVVLIDDIPQEGRENNVTKK